MVSSSGVIMEIFEISCKYFSTACESRLVIWVAILSCLIIFIYCFFQEQMTLASGGVSVSIAAEHLIRQIMPGKSCK